MEIKRPTKHEILKMQICYEFNSILSVLYDPSFCCILLWRLTVASVVLALFVYLWLCKRSVVFVWTVLACWVSFLHLCFFFRACLNEGVFIIPVWKCVCVWLVNGLWLEVCVYHWCLPRGAAGAHHMPAGHCSTAASISIEVPAHVQTAVLLVHIKSPAHSRSLRWSCCFQPACSPPHRAMLGSDSGLQGVDHDLKEMPRNLSLVFWQMKGRVVLKLSPLRSSSSSRTCPP